MSRTPRRTQTLGLVCENGSGCPLSLGQGSTCGGPSSRVPSWEGGRVGPPWAQVDGSGTRRQGRKCGHRPYSGMAGVPAGVTGQEGTASGQRGTCLHEASVPYASPSTLAQPDPCGDDRDVTDRSKGALVDARCAPGGGRPRGTRCPGVARPILLAVRLWNSSPVWVSLGPLRAGSPVKSPKSIHWPCPWAGPHL